MRLWKKVLSAVTAGALCVGGVGLPWGAECTGKRGNGAVGECGR